MTIDVSIATVYSGGVFTIFGLFSVLFSVFLLRLKKEASPLLFCACFDYVCFLKQIHIFFDDVIVNCMTACSGFKMVAQNSKWLLYDVIVTS